MNGRYLDEKKSYKFFPVILYIIVSFVRTNRNLTWKCTFYLKRLQYYVLLTKLDLCVYSMKMTTYVIRNALV